MCSAERPRLKVVLGIPAHALGSHGTEAPSKTVFPGRHRSIEQNRHGWFRTEAETWDDPRSGEAPSGLPAFRPRTGSRTISLMPGRRGLPRPSRALTGVGALGRAAEAVLLMGLAAAAQRWIPMPRWSTILGEPGPVEQRWLGRNESALPQYAATVIEWQVAAAVRRAERVVPGSPTCLAQAAAGQVMLRRRREPGTVMIGLRRTQGDANGRWEAHAWLLGRFGALTGGSAAAGFTATTSFRPKAGPPSRRKQSAPVHPQPGPFLAWATAAVVRLEYGLLQALPEPVALDAPRPTLAALGRSVAFHASKRCWHRSVQLWASRRTPES